MTGELTEFAASQQRSFDSATAAEERKRRGHFGTPAAIAEFMASMFQEVPSGAVHILDPGAGVGTLSAALCQRVLREATSKSLDFELWENDPQLAPLLQRTMSNCQQALRADGHKMEFTIRTDDFILANRQKSLFDGGPDPTFHLAVINPPYFKLRKESAQARAMEHVVHGQPNIYALFMAVAAELLLPAGEMVAITPRSYFNGPYFKRFRKWFFDRLSTRQIHIFESRAEAFKDDSVLQENVILRAVKGSAPRDIILTSSAGRDLENLRTDRAAYDKVIDNSHGDHVLRVTTNHLEHQIVAAMDQLPHRFRDLGFQISTGPVVTFRSTEFLRDERALDTAPLLWMHNVRPFVTRFPEKNGKPTHITVSDSSRRLLVPASTYVLLKRFTSKEEKRRLVAGIMQSTDSYSPWVGLENHLNYVYRKGVELSRSEAFGLAAFFNSALVDRYFRAISGNTQVNATEIRSMPVPDQPTLIGMGDQMQQSSTHGHADVELVVGRALGLPRGLIKQLLEAA